jgi:hypothetical protein
MASIEELEELERKVRELLDEQSVPAPTGVEYGFQCVRFFWHEANLALVVDLEDHEESEEGAVPHLRAAVGNDASFARRPQRNRFGVSEPKPH